MLVDFSVENFLSFNSRQTITFEPDTKVKGLEDHYFISVQDKQKGRTLNLLKIGMIYGANASGKTNLLKALNYLKKIALKTKTEKNTPLSFVPFELDYSKNTSMEVNFISNDTKYNYKIEFNKYSVVYEELNEYPYLTAGKSKNIYKRTTDENKQLSVIEFWKRKITDSATLESLRKNTLWNETVLAGFLKTNADIEALRIVSEWFNDYLEELMPWQTSLDMFLAEDINDHRVNEADVISALKRADFNISGISIEKRAPLTSYLQDVVESYNGECNIKEAFDVLDDIDSNTVPQIKLKHRTGQKEYELPYTLESEGTKRYFGLMGILLKLTESEKFMMIDELDTSLHPELYEAFIVSFLKNVRGSQLLFTTHNREFLQKKRLLRKDALWITDKREDGSTEVYSFADFDSSVIRDTTSIYNAYSIGKLGGVPNNASDLIFKTEG